MKPGSEPPTVMCCVCEREFTLGKNGVEWEGELICDTCGVVVRKRGGAVLSVMGSPVATKAVMSIDESILSMNRPGRGGSVGRD